MTRTQKYEALFGWALMYFIIFDRFDRAGALGVFALAVIFELGERITAARFERLRQRLRP